MKPTLNQGIKIYQRETTQIYTHIVCLQLEHITIPLDA